jgi:DNA modification methylase
MIQWMLRRGQGLLGASFGLGKASCQADAMRIIHNRFGGRTLIVCPLGARHQFTMEDGPRLGMDIQYVGNDADVEAADTPFLITNYERVRDGQIDPRKHDFIAISLDEGSTLRSLGSKTYQTFQTIFADVPYRFVATATPSPNEYKELIYYAQFLGVMDTGQALTRWFKRDSSKAGNLTLMPSHEHDFWMWVASWALFVNRPSDLGYSDEGYELPDLQVHWHCVSVNHQRAWTNTDNRGQARLILDAAGGVSEAAAEKRETLDARIAKMKEIVNEEANDHWIIWHHLEDERRAIHSALPHAVSVYGSQDPDIKEGHLLDFAHGRTQILSTKPRIAGAGCNFQRHCSRAIYLGIDHKFHDFIQSIHRLQRFQQPEPVDVHIIYAESEESIAQNLQRKWAQHDELQRKMQAIVRKYGLSHAALERDLRRQIGVNREKVNGHWFTSAHNDCVDELPRIESDSVGLIHTSIPFGNHYEYTEQYEDFGHNSSDDEFWKQMDFLIPELLRVLKPGRIAAIHVKDRILYGHQTQSGFMELDPFSDDCVRAFRKHGFLFEGRRTIVTDVVRENASTYRLGWSELCRDASKMGSGLPEYLLLFRKPPTDPTNSRADEPVTKEKSEYSRGRWQLDAHSLWRSNGNHIISPADIASMVDLSQVASIHKEEQLNGHYDHERHVAICEAIDERGHLPSSYMLLPPKVTRDESDMVWDDIVFMRTLNSNQGQKRRENHICPLPLDIVERTIRLYSNEGDLVLEPFAGLHTVPYVAINMGRSAYAIELNYQYWKDGVKYCQDAEVDRSAPTLFDLLEVV